MPNVLLPANVALIFLAQHVYSDLCCILAIFISGHFHLWDFGIQVSHLTITYSKINEQVLVQKLLLIPSFDFTKPNLIKTIFILGLLLDS